MTRAEEEKRFVFGDIVELYGWGAKYRLMYNVEDEDGEIRNKPGQPLCRAQLYAYRYVEIVRYKVTEDKTPEVLVWLKHDEEVDNVVCS